MGTEKVRKALQTGNVSRIYKDSLECTSQRARFKCTSPATLKTGLEASVVCEVNI